MKCCVGKSLVRPLDISNLAESTDGMSCTKINLKLDLNQNDIMAKKKVYHVGDEVRVIVPQFVERVGYPLTKKIVKQTLITKEDEKAIYDLLNRYYSASAVSPIMIDVTPDKNYEAILEVIAGVVMRKNSWGGKNRSLHLVEKAELINRTARVLSKKVVQTGEYVAGKSYSDYWTGEVDYEPAYLSNRKDYVLLKLYLPTYNIGTTDDEYWIQESNVIPYTYGE